ncbi:MAG: urease accessory protein UreF [Thermomicrobiales bacterium]
MTAPAQLLRLLQLTDSGFPTGAFAFSHGLEGLHAQGAVVNERDVGDFIAVHLREGFAGVECPAMTWSWRYAHDLDLTAVIALDHLVDAYKPVPAFQSSSVRTGRRLLESAAGLLSGPMLAGLRERISAGETPGHHPVAFGVTMEAAGVDIETASLALGAGFAGSLTVAAVRLGIIGQVAAQRTLAALHPAIVAAAARGRQTPLDDMGAFTPLTDIAGLRQPRLPGRIFAS